MRFEFDFITKTSELEFACELRYFQLGQICVPASDCDDIEMIMERLAESMKIDDLLKPPTPTSSEERIQNFRKGAIRAVLNTFYKFSPNKIEQVEQLLRETPTPEVYLSVFCRIYRAHNQQRFLKDWIMKKLSEDERWRVYREMLIDDFPLGLKKIEDLYTDN